MRKLLIIIALFAISLSAEPLTKYEKNLEYNGILKNLNMFVKTKNPEYIKKAYAAKIKLLDIIDKKRDSKQHQKVKKIILQLPVFLQYCVAGMVYNDRDMLTGKCYDKFREIEPDHSKYGHTSTSKEALLENLVIYLGDRYNEYDKSEKVALYTLKLYPNQAPTLFNLGIIYITSKNVRDKRFSNKTEYKCFTNKAIFTADRIGRPLGFYAPANYIRKHNLMENNPECKNFNFRKKLRELIKKEGF